MLGFRKLYECVIGEAVECSPVSKGQIVEQYAPEEKIIEAMSNEQERYFY